MNAIAYGFLSLQDVFENRVTTLGTGQLNTTLVQSAAEWDRLMRESLTRLSRRVTVASERYLLPGDGSLQPLDQWGNPVPVKGGAYYTVGYPIRGGGTAWGNNRVSRELMTVEQANQNTVDANRRDADWLIRYMLAALFTNTTYTFTDDTRPDDPTVTVQPLANGDAVAYPTVGGSAATAQHYLAQAAAIDDANNPFGTIYTTLRAHPSNAMSAMVSYIASNLVDDVGALTDFVDIGDPDIQLGDQADRVVGSTARILGFGDRILGKLKGSRQWIVEWSRLPDSYIYTQAIDSDPPLGMREYPSPALQGLFLESHSPDGNRAEYRFLRYCGFGVRNRVGATIMRIGNGAYAIPTGYNAGLFV
jgi:hypothetical protein